MKKCFKCGKEKELDFFYVHKQMKDGHLNKCIECTKKDVGKREYELRKEQIYCEKEKQRAKEKYYRLNYREKQFLYNKQKGYKNSTIKNLHKKLKLNSNLECHHWDYNQPLNVFIINKKTHRKIHTMITLCTDKLLFKYRNTDNYLGYEDHKSLIAEIEKLC